MATLTIYKAPTYTLTLQLYVRGGAATGSPLTLTEGASGVYTCTVSTGDYDGELIGFTSTVGPKFPIRDGVAYEGIPWSIVDATITPTPTIPAAITGLCSVLVVVANGSGDVVEGCEVNATLDDANNTTDGVLASKAVTSGTTDSNGQCTLTLVQYASFTLGGTYRLRVTDAAGKLLHNRRVRVPTSTTANAEDLTAV